MFLSNKRSQLALQAVSVNMALKAEELKARYAESQSEKRELQCEFEKTRTNLVR